MKQNEIEKLYSYKWVQWSWKSKLWMQKKKKIAIKFSVRKWIKMYITWNQKCMIVNKLIKLPYTYMYVLQNFHIHISISNK